MGIPRQSGKGVPAFVLLGIQGGVRVYLGRCIVFSPRPFWGARADGVLGRAR